MTFRHVYAVHFITYETDFGYCCRLDARKEKRRRSYEIRNRQQPPTRRLRIGRVKHESDIRVVFGAICLRVRISPKNKRHACLHDEICIVDPR